MKDQVIVITGASSGIGLALAEICAGRGARVVLAARRDKELKAIANRIGGLAVPTDVTQRADIDRLRDRAIAAHGRIDVWVANAGRGISRPVLQLTDADIDDMIAINVKSVVYGMQAVVPVFREQQRGHHITVSSMLARIPFATVRSAFDGLHAQGLQLELSGQGVFSVA